MVVAVVVVVVVMVVALVKSRPKNGGRWCWLTAGT